MMRPIARCILLWVFTSAVSVSAPAAGPIAYHATYEIEVDSATYTLSYDWSEFEHSGRSFERGPYTERLLTDYCFARLLTPKWAVIVRLPHSVSNNPAPVAEVLLVVPDDLKLVRSYKNPEPGKRIDGIFFLRSFSMTTEPDKRVEGRMSARERRLIQDIDQGKYATLYGNSYERLQWEQSPELLQQLKGLDKPTLLGHPAPFGKPNAPGFHGFNEFANRFIRGAAKDALKPTRVFFLCDGSSWTGSPAAVAVYRREQSLGPILKFAPFAVSARGLKFNQGDNSLYFDPKSGQLTLLVPRPLDSLTGWVFENP